MREAGGLRGVGVDDGSDIRPELVPSGAWPFQTCAPSSRTDAGLQNHDHIFGTKLLGRAGRVIMMRHGSNVPIRLPDVAGVKAQFSRRRWPALHKSATGRRHRFEESFIGERCEQ